MRFAPFAVLALTTALLAPSIASAAQINCDGELDISVGTHTGYFTDVIDRLDWNQGYVHFVFHDSGDSKYYCVRQNTTNPNIVAVAMKALLLHNKVMITTADGYWLTGVAFNASE